MLDRQISIGKKIFNKSLLSLHKLKWLCRRLWRKFIEPKLKSTKHGAIKILRILNFKRREEDTFNQQTFWNIQQRENPFIHSYLVLHPSNLRLFSFRHFILHKFRDSTPHASTWMQFLLCQIIQTMISTWKYFAPAVSVKNRTCAIILKKRSELIILSLEVSLKNKTCVIIILLLTNRDHKLKCHKTKP